MGEDRLADVLGAWYEARDSGQPQDPADLIAAHPELADELRVHFELMETIGGARPGSVPVPEQLSSYEILAELGAGGMGTVYHGRVAQAAAGLAAGAEVALKVIHPRLLSQAGFFKRFLREAQIGQQVQHENVVRTYDCDATEADGRAAHYLVMEYVEGQTLRELLDELERVPEELCRHIGREVAKGLAAIHEAGVVHRDVKPENVLITPEHVVKVMDLGVARLQDEAIRLSQAGAFVGSLEYAAPEQFTTADGEPDGRADLHALGVLLYELSTGVHPYRDEDASRVLHRILEEEPRKAGEVNPQLSPFFEEVAHTLIAKDRDARFQAASDLAGVLDKGEKSEWWKARAKELRIETKRPLRRIRIPRETALYGRDDDVAKLHALYEQAKAGDGRVLLIEGEAGIGKTRLVDEFMGRLRQEGEDLNFLFGSYPPGGAATASGAFSTAYREQFGDEGLEETLEDYLKSTPILAPAFAALLRGETTPEDAEILTKDSLQTVFVHATHALAAERTTVVLIDDLHYAPAEGRALFSALAGAVPGRRILLIGTMRRGVSEAWTSTVTRQSHADFLPLGRLGPKDLTRLLKDAFQSERLAMELGFRIAEKSDGNPFFALEIIRGLREEEYITQGVDGTWVRSKVIREIHVPSSVVDLVMARIAVLGDTDRDLLDMAACCGFEFDPSLVGDGSGLSRIEALRHFARIERNHRLVRSAGRRYVFDHHQVQEALYSALNEQLRQEYHAFLAEAMEARSGVAAVRPGELDGTACVEICEHHLRGGHPDRALSYLDDALEYLAAGFIHERALALAERALGVPELLQGESRLRVLLRTCKRLDVLGRRDEQEGALVEARVLAEASGDVAQLARVETAATHLTRRTGRNEEALAHARKALELHTVVGERWALAGATSDLGTIHKAMDRTEEARKCFERALTIVRELGRRDGEAAYTINLAGVASVESRHAEAETLLRRGLQLAEESGVRAWAARALTNLGNVHSALGRPAEAARAWERALTLNQEMGDRPGAAGVLVNLGLSCKGRGRFAEALDYLERGLSLLREVGERKGEAVALVNLGPLYVSLGARERGRGFLQSALATCREIGARFPEGYALVGLAKAAAEEGRFEDALRLSEEALALRRTIGHEDGVCGCLLEIGELQAREGSVDEARESFVEALQLAEKNRTRPLITLAGLLLAGLPGETVPTEQLPPDDEDTEAGLPRTRFLVWKATSDPKHLEVAKRLLDQLVEHAPEEYRESMLTNVRLHREIMEAWAMHGDEAEKEDEA